MVYCNYLNNRGFCKHGCSRVNGTQQIVCHRFARGRCKKSGKACYHGLHCWREKPNPTQPQGDGFRPRATETELQKHLATLMLSPKCEDLLDLDSEILEAVYRKIAVKRHPDKASQVDVCRPASVSCESFIQLQTAKDYVKQMLPFGSDNNSATLSADIGNDCHRGLHSKRRKLTPTQPRGDGFRPYTTDTAVETTLRKHLATLMLSPKCEDLLDLTPEILETLYTKIAAKRHPDKCAEAGVFRPASVRCDRFLQLQMAKEYVKDMIPFRIAAATDTFPANGAAITDLPPSSPTAKRMPRVSSRKKQSTQQFDSSVVYNVDSDSNMD